MKQSNVEKGIFWSALAIVAALVIPVLFNPKQGTAVLGDLHHLIAKSLSSIYLWSVVVALGFLMWLAFSKYGKIKFGEPDTKPEFSTFSWLAMLFTAGIGASITYWSAIEWAYYYTEPPFGAQPKTIQAADWAATYGLFHWGFSAWVLYCLPALPIAYNLYVRKNSSVKLSAACGGVLKKGENGWIGKSIDVFFMVGLVGGIGAALGLGLPLISEGISNLFHITRTSTLDITLIVILTLIFCVSTYFGLKKGLKRLANINTYLFLALSAFVLLAGPTLFIISRFTDSVGILLQNFFRMSFYTDSIAHSGFPEAWTVFYWAWWITCAPYMGIFVAKISKGRTIRQVIFAECIGGTIGCWTAFSIFGNTGLYFELHKLVPVIDILEKKGGEAAIAAIYQGLPGGNIALLVIVIITLIFLSATLDSSSYTLASAASKTLSLDGEPARWHKIFWAFVIELVAFSMMFGGGLHALQSVVVITSVPLILIMAMAAISLVKWIKEDQIKKEVEIYNEQTSKRSS
ncbi:BCCT family transporter [Ectobacillus polymachus]|uniref:BCCT family transporter n=1 Tax=Ectobacillus polymachus TaxID=1508806 RepID=UPI003A86CA8A